MLLPTWRTSVSTTANAGPASNGAPVELTEVIDDLVGSAERAAFVRDALRDRLNGQRRLRALAALTDRFAANPAPAWRTSESSEQWVRNLRDEWNGRPADGMSDDDRPRIG
jgi:hypothetical protein